MERYTAMYPRGQPSHPDDLVTAYDALRASRTIPGSTTAGGNLERPRGTSRTSASSAWHQP
jgi:hypothetical protein